MAAGDFFKSQFRQLLLRQLSITPWPPYRAIDWRAYCRQEGPGGKLFLFEPFFLLAESQGGPDVYYRHLQSFL